MHKDHLNGARGPQRKATNGSQCTPGDSTPKEVTVLNEEFPLYADPESPRASSLNSQASPPLDREAENLKLFKVFMKRNLPHEKPAPDLLVRIHQKIDALKQG